MKAKASKVRLIVLISILVLIVGGFAVYKIVEYKKSKDPANLPISGAHLINLEGKIIEIKSNNSIIVEVIKERDPEHFKKEDKVLVDFDSLGAYEFRKNEGSDGSYVLIDEYEMQVGDIISAEYFSDYDFTEKPEKDGYKYLDTRLIEIYFSDYENRVFSEDQ